MRYICQVKHFGAELQLKALRERKAAVQTHIRIDQTGASQIVRAACSKTPRLRGGKRRDVVPLINTADLLRCADAIRELGRSNRIESGVRGRNRKGRARA